MAPRTQDDIEPGSKPGIRLLDRVEPIEACTEYAIVYAATATSPTNRPRITIIPT